MHFHVDMPSGPVLGARVRPHDDEPVGLEVVGVQVEGHGFIVQWNRRCAVVFPNDMLRVGDIIIAANEARTPADIERVLLDASKARLLVISRAMSELQWYI